MFHPLVLAPLANVDEVLHAKPLNFHPSEGFKL